MLYIPAILRSKGLVARASVLLAEKKKRISYYYPQLLGSLAWSCGASLAERIQLGHRKLSF